MRVIRLEQLRFKYKMMYGFGIEIFLMFCLVLTSLIGIGSVQRKMLYYVERVQTADTEVKMCRIETNNGARNLREMALTDDKAEQEAYQKAAAEAINTLDAHLAELERSGVIGKELFVRYQETVKNWIEIGKEIEKELLNGNREKGIQLIYSECAPTLQEVIKISKEIDEQTTELRHKTVKENERIIIISAITISAVLVMAIILAVRTARRIIGCILVPLKELEHASKEMMQGQFHTKITYQSADEMGTLADNMNQTMEVLSGIVDDITYLMNEMAEQNFDINSRQEERYLGQFGPVLQAIHTMNRKISDTIYQINASAQQVSSSSQQIAISSQALAQGAMEQGTAVEELMNAMDTISDQVNTTAAHAADTNALTAKTGAEVVFCNQKMSEMMGAMEKISVQSDEIKEIVKSIQDIAYQTNLLSLNAAVEAASAGEAGKGFAVVADAVRQLAARSSEASKGTSVLIKGTIEAVQEGMRIAKETAESLERIKGGSGPIVEKVGEIAEAANYQMSAAGEINGEVRQISDVVQTNSAAAQESAAESEELSAQAQTLENLVAQFTLKEKTI